ncbi:MAG: hypothetical protein IJP63_08820 [Acholeplasmatales bacterium]|nr:hypothetical protein [Acholeplasmatales bacterium]
MNINYEKNQIMVYGKAIKYDMFIKKLSELSGEQIYGFFNSRGIMLPRMMNCFALISVLNNKIKFLHSNSLTKDYFVRLQHYSSFTETQLENLFLALNPTSEDFSQYRFNLMKLIVDNYEALDINDGEITYLKNLKKTKIKGFEEYCGYVSAACLEQPGTFDGSLIEDLKKDLMFTATNQEIILIGEKYGITVPERLQKDEYVGFIKYYLSQQGRLTEEADEVLDEMSINGLSIYAKREGIPMQPAMSKDDLVTYLFYILEQCEIPYSTVSQIVYDESIYKPLEFTIDLSAITPFGNGDAKKIIHYQGEEADSEEFNKMLDLINNPVEIVEEPVEEKVEELPAVEIERPLKPGETKAVLEELKKEPIKEEPKPQEIKIEQAPVKKEVVVPLKDKLGIDINSTIPNEQYALKEKKLFKNSRSKNITICVFAGLIVILAGVALGIAIL